MPDAVDILMQEFAAAWSAEKVGGKPTFAADMWVTHDEDGLWLWKSPPKYDKEARLFVAADPKDGESFEEYDFRTQAIRLGDAVPGVKVGRWLVTLRLGAAAEAAS